MLRRLLRWFRGHEGAPTPDGSGGVSDPPTGPPEPGWSAVPPMPLAVGPSRTTAPSRRFSRELSTRRPARVSALRIGHEVSSDARPGVVTATTVHRTPEPTSPAPVRPRLDAGPAWRRRREGTRADRGPRWPDPAPDDPRSASQPATRGPVPEDPVEVELPTRPVPRSLPAAGTERRAPATHPMHLPDDVGRVAPRPLAPVSRSPAGDTPPRETPPGPEGPAASRTVERTDRGEPVEPVRPAERADVAPGAGADPRSEPPSDDVGRNDEPTRPSGLGSPMSTRPTTARPLPLGDRPPPRRIQRRAEPERDTPEAGRTDPERTRAAGEERTTGGDEPPVEGSPPQEEEPSPRDEASSRAEPPRRASTDRGGTTSRPSVPLAGGEVRVSRSVEQESATGGRGTDRGTGGTPTRHPGSDAASDAARRAEPSGSGRPAPPPSPGRPRAPLTGDRTILRFPDDGLPTRPTAPETTGGGPGAAPVPVRHEPPGPRAGTTGSPPRRTKAPMDPARATSSRSGPSPAGGPSARPPSTQSRRPPLRRSSEPGRSVPDGERATAAPGTAVEDVGGQARAAATGPTPTPPGPDPGSVAVRSGLADRQDDGSVVFRVPEPPGTAPLPGDVAADSGDSPATPPPPAAGEDADGERLERLFRRLYPRVREELRWDLLAERERTGLLTDLDR